MVMSRWYGVSLDRRELDKVPHRAGIIDRSDLSARRGDRLDFP